MRVSEQIAKLEEAFLSTIETEFPDPLTDSERACLHAYLVLSHSVLEEDIEASFEGFFDDVAIEMSGDSHPTSAVTLAYAVAEQLHEKYRVTYKQRDVVGLVRGTGRRIIETAVRENHGLKPENIEKLAKAVGVDWPSFEATLTTALADLNTLGTKRGSSSHLSPFSPKVTSITRAFDPDDVRQWVADGLSALEQIRANLASRIPAMRPADIERRPRFRAPALRASRLVRR